MTPLERRRVVPSMSPRGTLAVSVGRRRRRDTPGTLSGRAALSAAPPPVHGPAHPSAPRVVMVSRLELRSLRDVPGFLRAAMRLRRAFRSSAGAVTLRLAASPLAGTFWTWSTWADERGLREYTRSPLHVEVMRSYGPRLRGSAFRTLDPSHDELPATWTEVRALTAPVRPDPEQGSDRADGTSAGRVPGQGR